jgi:hypothetical protein
MAPWKQQDSSSSSSRRCSHKALQRLVLLPAVFRNVPQGRDPYHCMQQQQQQHPQQQRLRHGFGRSGRQVRGH